MEVVMPEISIRLATANDWETIVDFNCRLADETENKKLDPDVIGPGVRAVLEDPSKGRYFVASDGTRIVGQLMHTFEWSDWRNGWIWWLQSVYVVDDYRRQGVFRKLNQHLADLAETDLEVVGLRLYVENENERAHSTYEKIGMDRAGYFVMERLFYKLEAAR